MPKVYGTDFRSKVLEAYLNKEGSISELALRFKISASTVKRIARRYRETGKVVLYLHNSGRHELIDDVGKRTIVQLLNNKPDLTLHELQMEYSKIHKIKPVITVFHNVLKTLNFRRKKKSAFAQQQLRDDVKKKDKNL